jgi:hypothetical protein
MPRNIFVLMYHRHKLLNLIMGRHYATNRKVAGSIPDEVIGFFFFQLT